MSQEPSSRDMVPGFAAAVRARREELGLSLAEVAGRAGTHQASVSKLELEHRSPSLRVALAMAEALEIPLADLLDRATKEAKRAARSAKKLAE